MSSSNYNGIHANTNMNGNVAQGSNSASNLHDYRAVQQANSQSVATPERVVPEVVITTSVEEHKPVGVNGEQKATTNCSAETHHGVDNSHLKAYDANEKQITIVKRRKKRTTQEQLDLEKTVTQKIQEGHPIQAIALWLKISLDVTRKIFVKLVQGGNQAQILAPKYEVVKGGLKVKDLPLLGSTDADFFKVERYENGVIIKPFNTMEN